MLDSVKEVRDRLRNPVNGRQSSELDIQSHYYRRKDVRIAELTSELASARRDLVSIQRDLASTQIELRRERHRADQLIPNAIDALLVVGGRRPTVKQVIQAVCQEFHVTFNGIMSRQQILVLAYPRKVAYYLAGELTELPLAQIGRRMGRDHTTVLVGIKSIKKAVESGDEKLKAHIASIKTALGIDAA